jgi:deazaflavin-dependent oxidoreductase (nitroreductase family)
MPPFMGEQHCGASPGALVLRAGSGREPDPQRAATAAARLTGAFPRRLARRDARVLASSSPPARGTACALGRRLGLAAWSPGAADPSERYSRAVPLPSVDPAAPPSLSARVIEPIALTKAGTWFLKNVSRRVDPALVRLSRGRVSTIVFTPVALLTTTGARSGLARTTPLLYFTDRDRVVLMASNYGGSKHPAWYHNVRSNPEVTLLAGGHVGRYRGRETTGEERERLWGPRSS